MNYYCIYITIGSFKLSSCQFSTKSLLEWKYKLRSRPYSDMFMHYVWMGSYNRQYWKAISYAFLAENTNVCVFFFPVGKQTWGATVIEGHWTQYISCRQRSTSRCSEIKLTLHVLNVNLNWIIHNTQVIGISF